MRAARARSSFCSTSVATLGAPVPSQGELCLTVEPSIRRVEDGYTLAFSPKDLVERQPQLNGEYWDEWRATSCPALVVRGTESRAVEGAILERMAAMRPHTQLVSIEAGHVVHHDAPSLFLAAVEDFLGSLAP